MGIRLLEIVLLLQCGNQLQMSDSNTGYRLAAEVNRQHSECVCIKTIYTHTPSAADSLRPRDGTQWILTSNVDPRAV